MEKLLELEVCVFQFFIGLDGACQDPKTIFFSLCIHSLIHDDILAKNLNNDMNNNWVTNLWGSELRYKGNVCSLFNYHVKEVSLHN